MKEEKDNNDNRRKDGGDFAGVFPSRLIDDDDNGPRSNAGGLLSSPGRRLTIFVCPLAQGGGGKHINRNICINGLSGDCFSCYMKNYTTQ